MTGYMTSQRKLSAVSYQLSALSEKGASVPRLLFADTWHLLFC
jgi:hypothetical protein